MKYKKVNKSGGITIPQEIRHQLGINAGMALAIEVDQNGLHITKYVSTCMLCSSPDDIATVHGYDICRKCTEDALRRFADDDRAGNQD